MLIGHINKTFPRTKEKQIAAQGIPHPYYVYHNPKEKNTLVKVSGPALQGSAFIGFHDPC